MHGQVDEQIWPVFLSLFSSSLDDCKVDTIVE